MEATKANHQMKTFLTMTTMLRSTRRYRQRWTEVGVCARRCRLLSDRHCSKVMGKVVRIRSRFRNALVQIQPVLLGAVSSRFFGRRHHLSTSGRNSTNTSMHGRLLRKKSKSYRVIDATLTRPRFRRMLEVQHRLRLRRHDSRYKYSSLSGVPVRPDL